MPKHCLHFFVVFHFFILSKPLAQSAVPDTGFYRSALHHVIDLYIDSVKENLRLYNGTEFTGNFRGISGHPFFEYAEPQKGDIFYEGIRYPGMLFSYDILNDELLFSNLDGRPNIKLDNRQINWFTIGDRLFVHIRNDTAGINFPGNGFYEMLYEGTGTVLAKRRKQLHESAKTDEASRFIQWNTYYVRKNNVYYTVDSKRSLLAVVGDRKSEAGKFMQKEKLNFKKDAANTIVRVMDWYTKLKN